MARAAELLTDPPDPVAEAELAASFHRFLSKPAKTDPGCMAKLAIVEALRAGRLELHVVQAHAEEGRIGSVQGRRNEQASGALRTRAGCPGRIDGRRRLL